MTRIENDFLARQTALRRFVGTHLSKEDQIRVSKLIANYVAAAIRLDRARAKVPPPPPKKPKAAHEHPLEHAANKLEQAIDRFFGSLGL